MKLIIIFLLFFVVVACDKPNPEPEKADPIYNDIVAEIGAANSAVTAAEKELEGFEKEAAAVVPQTGQHKYAGKRVSETAAKLEKLRQMKKYWEIRAETRKEWARKSYMTAYKAKKPWPDPKEYEQYKVLRKLEQAPRHWNLKERIDQSRAGVSFEPGGSPSPGVSGETATPKEH